MNGNKCTIGALLLFNFIFPSYVFSDIRVTLSKEIKEATIEHDHKCEVISALTDSKIRTLFKSDGEAISSVRCEHMDYFGIKSENMSIHVNEGKLISPLSHNKNLVLDWEVGTRTKGSWFCQVMQQTMSALVKLCIKPIYQLSLTIYNRAINTVQTYTAHTSKYYFKDGDDFVVGCNKSGQLEFGEYLKAQYINSFRTTNADFNANDEGNYIRSVESSIVSNSWKLTAEDNGSSIQCELMEGLRTNIPITSIQVNLVMVPGHVKTSLFPPVKRPKVTTERTTSRRTLKNKSRSLSPVYTTSNRPETTTVPPESMTESPNSLDKTLVWLVPVLASGSTITIFGTVLVGVLFVYCRNRKSSSPNQTPVPVVQPNINDRVCYTTFEDHTYCYIDPVELRKNYVNPTYK